MAEDTVILRVEDVVTEFGGRRRFLRRPEPSVRAVDGVSLELRRGRAPRTRGGIGLRKVDPRAHHPRHPEGDRGRDPARRAPGERSPSAAGARRPPPTSSTSTRTPAPPSTRGGASAAPSRKGCSSTGSPSSAERTERIDRVLDAVGLDQSFKPRYPHELSGGQLRRVGPRPNPQPLAAHRHSRRADLRPRHVRAGDGSEARPGPSGTARTHVHLHLPRPLGGRANVHPGGDHVPRPNRREGGDEAGVRESEAPVHEGPPLRCAPAAAGSDDGGEPHPGRPAERRRHSFRVRLSNPVSTCRHRVRRKWSPARSEPVTATRSPAFAGASSSPHISPTSWASGTSRFTDPDDGRELPWGKWPKEEWVVHESHPSTGKPFLCLPGIREYHTHSSHVREQVGAVPAPRHLPASRHR